MITIIIIIVFNFKTSRSSFWPHVKGTQHQNTPRGAALKLNISISLVSERPRKFEKPILMPPNMTSSLKEKFNILGNTLIHFLTKNVEVFPEMLYYTFKWRCSIWRQLAYLKT